MKTAHERYLEWFKEQTMQGIEPTPELAFIFAYTIQHNENCDILDVDAPTNSTVQYDEALAELTTRMYGE